MHGRPSNINAVPISISTGKLARPQRVKMFTDQIDEPFRSIGDPFRSIRETFRSIREPFESIRDPFRSIREPFRNIRDPVRSIREPLGGRISLLPQDIAYAKSCWKESIVTHRSSGTVNEGRDTRTMPSSTPVPPSHCDTGPIERHCNADQ